MIEYGKILTNEVNFVRYILTLFWTLLLAHMATYVISSMIGSSYDFNTATVLGVSMTVFILIIANLLPSEPVESHH